MLPRSTRQHQARLWLCCRRALNNAAPDSVLSKAWRLHVRTRSQLPFLRLNVRWLSDCCVSR
eukprot:6178757-Pleurochrysis_carterae.AAC.3